MPSDNTTETEDDSNSTDATTEEQMGTAEVRFLSIRLLEPTEALATWAPPNGTSSIAYTAEISYDGNSWKALKLEDPTSTFAEFMITDQRGFQIRVTPEGGAPSMADWMPKRMGKGKDMGKGKQ
jgi:hypothetical protein